MVTCCVALASAQGVSATESSSWLGLSPVGPELWTAPPAPPGERAQIGSAAQLDTEHRPAAPSDVDDLAKTLKHPDLSTEDLAKAAQNPVADMISVPFQNNVYFNAGPERRTLYNLNIQPVIPFHLSEEWNLITRTIVPIIYDPGLLPGQDQVAGMGDINPSLFLSPAKPVGGWILGAGPTFTLPTGTSSRLTDGQVLVGPTAVALRMDGPLVYGALINQQWSVGGWTDQYISKMLVQPFFNINFEDGWYLNTSPIITADWTAPNSSDTWTVPVGGGLGKILRIGDLPVNINFQAFYNVVTPSYGPTWSIRLQVQLLFP